MSFSCTNRGVPKVRWTVGISSRSRETSTIFGKLPIGYQCQPTANCLATKTA